MHTAPLARESLSYERERERERETERQTDRQTVGHKQTARVYEGGGGLRIKQSERDSVRVRHESVCVGVCVCVCACVCVYDTERDRETETERLAGFVVFPGVVTITHTYTTPADGDRGSASR